MRPLFSKRSADHIFQEKLNNLEQKPGRHVWDNIATQLEPAPSNYYYLKLSGLATALLLLLGSVLYISINDTPTTIAFSDEQYPQALQLVEFKLNNAEVISEKNTFHSKALQLYIDQNELLASSRSRQNRTRLNFPGRSENVEEMASRESGVGDNNIGFPLSSLSANELESLLSTNIPNPSDLKRLQLKGEDIKGFHIGPSFGFNNTWVLSRKDDRDERNAEYKMKFGTSYGIALGYDFNGHSGVEIDWIMSSNEGQAFETKTELGSSTSKVKLNYTRIPVIFKYRMSKMSGSGTPIAVNYLMGMQYGRLNWINIDDNIDFLKPADFSEHEWGILFGLEYDFYLNDNYSLTLGGRGNITTDINIFPLLSNDNFNNLHNFSLGITARFNYLFKPHK